MIGYTGKILLVLSIGAMVKSPEAEIHPRMRRNACDDSNEHCSSWSESGFCKDDRYLDYMRKNCKKSCNLCGACKDNHEHCQTWAGYGYCTHKDYGDYMKSTCPKACGTCSGPGPTTLPPVTVQPTGGPQGSILDGCSFNSDTCEWLDVPFDDDEDFTVTSGSSGGGGPSSGAGGSGGYAYVKNTGVAQLLLPMELILDPKSNHGAICMTFNYHMAGSGSLRLKELKNSRGSPSTTLKTINGNQGNQWRTAQVDVTAAADRQLMLEASSQGSVIAIDEIRFGDRRC